MQICLRENCSGCFACRNVCPENCISMVEGKLGHVYPEVDEKRCISCGACSRVCPQNNPPEFFAPREVFAAHSRSEDEHKKSTSGGLASLFSRKVLERGGVVYGCSSKASGGIKHTRIEKESDLWLLRGSKYVQSHINEVYPDIKRDLADNRLVLFIGTPCQTAGLINYLKRPYDNLITVDLLCHGVPSQKILFEHLESIGGTAEYVSFRESGGHFLRTFDNDKNTVYRQKASDDDYYLCFYDNQTLRDSCFRCSFSRKERCSDITIGDFWGLGSDSAVKSGDGVSVALVSTDKGYDFFSSLEDELISERREADEAVKGNHPLRTPATKPKNNDKFVSLYEKYGFRKAARKILFKKRLREGIKRPIRKLLKHK